jgi:hypothetical protein
VHDIDGLDFEDDWCVPSARCGLAAATVSSGSRASTAGVIGME